MSSDDFKVDDQWAESFTARIGLSSDLCSSCGANMKRVGENRIICLNACHAPGFAKAMSEALGTTPEDDE